MIQNKSKKNFYFFGPIEEKLNVIDGTKCLYLKKVNDSFWYIWKHFINLSIHILTIHKYRPEQSIAIAVDCIIFGFDSKDLKLLLFRRKTDPLKGSWSLIGELIDNDVSLDQSAKDILYRLSGLENVFLKQLRTYGLVDRDPLERVVSVAYYSLIRIDEFNLQSLENHDAKWFDFDQIPELILDHGQMVDDAIKSLRSSARYNPLGFELLPEYFTIQQLQTLYESIYRTAFDPGNFRKKMLSLHILERTGKKDKSASKKGAYLYRFKKENLKQFPTQTGDFESIKEVIKF